MESKMPALRGPELLLVGVVVDVAGASQGDLVVREFAALLDGRSFGVRIGSRFLRRPRDLVDIGRVNAVDWWDHGLVL
jgi:hypothetical protein